MYMWDHFHPITGFYTSTVGLLAEKVFCFFFFFPPLKLIVWDFDIDLQYEKAMQVF